MNAKTLQKGSSLYLTYMIMVLLLSIVFGVNLILIGQIKVIRGMGNSVGAFYAADTGIEQVLMNRDLPDDIIGPPDLENGAAYYVNVTCNPSMPTCPPEHQDVACNATNYCIRSYGNFRQTTRAVEITY